VSPSRRPPFRADHVGSLLRPAALKQASKDLAAKKIGAEAFGKAQDEAIAGVVRMQEEVGLEVVTDGEFRRMSYWGRFVERCSGFTIKPAVFKFRDDHGHEVDFTATYASAKLQRNQPLAVDEFAFTKTVVKRAMPKITLPAPSTMHFYRCTDYADPSVYRDLPAFMDDLTRIFREEIASLAAEGCRYIQLDEVAVAMLCDPDIRGIVAKAGQDPDVLVDAYIDAINAAVGEAPKDMLIGIHMCRGNFKGHYLSKGGYLSVAERFFQRANCTHFLLEYDTDRAGDFEPLRFVPKSKGVVIGIMSTKTAELESLDTLKRRTHEAAKCIDLERLSIGPQCGFASTVAGNPLTEVQQRAKLERLVEAARQIWP
jgi:5-methyltetrahydropteroyltriglutamate--homocysteine methyltransferase